MKYIFPCHKKLLICMIVISCFGLLSGVWYGLQMNPDDVLLCQTLIQSNLCISIDSFQYFLKVCLLEGFMVLFLFLSGFSILGIPLILTVLFFCGFRFGLIGLMLLQMYQMQGILIVLVILIPSACLKMGVEYAIAAVSMQLSFSFIESCKGVKKNEILHCINSRCTSLIVCLGFVVIYGAYQSTIGLWMMHLFESGL